MKTDLMIQYSSNTEHLHIFTIQSGTFQIENFRMDWWSSPYHFACSFHLVQVSADMKGALLFCHYPPPCLIMLSWCLPCLQMYGLNLNSDVLCARLVPVCVLQFSRQENSVKSSWADIHISQFEHTKVSGTNFVSILRVQYHEDGD